MVCDCDGSNEVNVNGFPRLWGAAASRCHMHVLSAFQSERPRHFRDTEHLWISRNRDQRDGRLRSDRGLFKSH